MRSPNPSAVARLLRSRVQLVPEPVEPDPVLPGRLVEPPNRGVSVAPTTAATRTPVSRTSPMCGHCQHGREGHGVQYGALVGWHTWAPELPRHPRLWSEICTGPGEGVSGERVP